MKGERHYGTIQGGRLRAASLAAAVKSYPEGTSLEFTVRKSVKRRSSPQNRYYWGVVLSIATKSIKELGTPITPDELHTFWKRLIAPVDVVVSGDGEVVQFGKSTTEMDALEFSAYVDSCVAWCAERGIQIPAPGEQTQLDIAA